MGSTSVGRAGGQPPEDNSFEEAAQEAASNHSEEEDSGELEEGDEDGDDDDEDMDLERHQETNYADVAENEDVSLALYDPPVRPMIEFQTGSGQYCQAQVLR